MFNAVWGLVLGTEPNPGAKSGTLHEWHFRSSLDHWSAVFGMIFALNYPAAAAWLQRVEGKPMHTTTRGGGSGGESGGKSTGGNSGVGGVPNKSGIASRRVNGVDVDAMDVSDGLSDDEEQPILSGSSPASPSSSESVNATSKGVVVVSPYSTPAKLIVLVPMLLATL